MNNEFKYFFSNDEINITFDSNGVAWFKAYEIAKVLGYTRTNDMIRNLPDNERLRKFDVTAQSGPYANPQEIIMINEYGLYRIIMRAHYKSNPIIAEFQNWVFYTILPSIRRYGAYITPEVREQLINNPNLINELNNKISKLENDLYKEQHKYDAVRPDGKRTLYMILDDPNNIAVNIIRNKAKENDQLRSNINELNVTIDAMTGDDKCVDSYTLARLIWNTDANIGRTRLYTLLCKDGYIMRNSNNSWIPTQLAVNAGYIKLSEDGGPKLLFTVLGISYFINRYSGVQV